jgi:hypothetical protein
LTCNDAQLGATLSNSVGSVASSVVAMTIFAADARSGIYKGFATNGELYNVKVDFDGKLYEVKAPSGEVVSGTLTPDVDGRGNAETGAFAMSTPQLVNVGGTFRYADDLIVGNIPVGNTSFNGLVPFIGARNFVRAASEVTRTVDMKIMGLDFGTTSLDSLIATGQLTASGFTICSGGSLSDVSGCVAAGSNLTNYAIAYQADGSAVLTNTANATDTLTGYFAKVGTGYLYLRASPNSTGNKRFRVGLESLSSLNTDVKGSSIGYRGNLQARLVGFSYSDSNTIAAGPPLALSAIPQNVVLASGLFSYGDSVTGAYFGAQSTRIVVVIGARNAAFPAINGFMVLGMR